MIGAIRCPMNLLKVGPGVKPADLAPLLETLEPANREGRQSGKYVLTTSQQRSLKSAKYEYEEVEGSTRRLIAAFTFFSNVIEI